MISTKSRCPVQVSYFCANRFCNYLSGATGYPFAPLYLDKRIFATAADKRIPNSFLKLQNALNWLAALGDGITPAFAATRRLGLGGPICRRTQQSARGLPGAVPGAHQAALPGAASAPRNRTAIAARRRQNSFGPAARRPAGCG